MDGSRPVGHFRLVGASRWILICAGSFPVSSAKREQPVPALPCGNHSAVESLPSEVLIIIVSDLPLDSVLNLASTSRSLRAGILSNDYLANVWIYHNAPFWIPVPTQTPRESEPSTTVPVAYLASRWPAQTLMNVAFPIGLDWEYIRQCTRSGSMRNRERIWYTALDIEDAADLAGV